MESTEYNRYEFVYSLFPLCGFFFFPFNYISFHFWLNWVFVALQGPSRVAVSRGLHCFVAVCGLLIAAAPLVGHRLWVCRLQLLQHTGSVVAAPGLWSADSVAP